VYKKERRYVMAGKRGEDPRLEEVKAALQSLQRIELNPSPHIELKQPVPVADKRPAQGKRLGAFALAMIAAGTVIVLAIDLFLKYGPAPPPSQQAAEINSQAGQPDAGNPGAGRTFTNVPAKTDQPARPPAAAVPPAFPPPDPRISAAIIDN